MTLATAKRGDCVRGALQTLNAVPQKRGGRSRGFDRCKARENAWCVSGGVCAFESVSGEGPAREPRGRGADYRDVWNMMGVKARLLIRSIFL